MCESTTTTTTTVDLLSIPQSREGNMLFPTFSVSVANPRELLETVADPVRGLLNPDYGDTAVSKQSNDAP